MRAALFIIAFVWTSPALAKCVPFKAKSGGTSVDFSIPGDYVNICAKDKALCKKLTDGYPATTKTVGYFATPEEWKKFKKKEIIGFTHYLIAQFAEGIKVSDWKGYKDYVHSHSGAGPDHTTLPEMIKKNGEADLGIAHEQDDAVITGKIVRTQLAAGTDMVMTALNIVMKTKNRVLTLYTFQDVTKDNDPRPTEDLAKEWIACIQKANN